MPLVGMQAEHNFSVPSEFSIAHDSSSSKLVEQTLMYSPVVQFEFCSDWIWPHVARCKKAESIWGHGDN